MNEIVTQENKLTAVEVRAQVNLIQEVMKSVMKKDTHYGTIPGCAKPTLYKAGAEVLATTFRLAVQPEIQDLSIEDEIRYRVLVKLTSIGTGNLVGVGIGECSTNEEKYKWRKAVCDKEWESTDELRRREVWKKGQQGEYQVKQVRTNMSDLANTVLKMAKKRAQVDAILTATAASDIFTQDIEDLPEEIQKGVAEQNGKPVNKKPDVKEPEATQPPPQEQPPAQPDNPNPISDPQQKRLYAIARNAGMTKDGFKEWLLFNYEIKSTRDITKEKYDTICQAAEKWKPNGS